LFTAALLPFPTAVVSYAMQRGIASDDARTAVAFNAVIGVLMCASWYAFFRYLATNPRLHEDDVEPRSFRNECRRAALGCGLYLLAGFAGCLLAPVVALIVFFLLPAFYGATSHGMAELHDAFPASGRATLDADP
jgi:TMEM175 potassium channel family protein